MMNRIPQVNVISIVDGRNLLFGAQTIEDSTGIARNDPSIRLKVAQTVDFLSHDRPFVKQILVAKQDERLNSVWNLWREQSYDVQLLPGHEGREVAVDDVMHAQALNELHKDYRAPVVLQLVTGDGNSNHGRTNFRDVVVAALRKSPPVSVEIYAFKRSCSRHLRVLEEQYSQHVRIIELDAYREALTYNQVRHLPPPPRDESAPDTFRVTRQSQISTSVDWRGIRVAKLLHEWLIARGHDEQPMLTSAPLASFYSSYPGAREIIQGSKAAGCKLGIQSFVAMHPAMLHFTRSESGEAAITALRSSPTEHEHDVLSDASSSESALSSEWEQVTLALARSLQDAFICPISGESMTDPVFTADGHTYERESIEQWFVVTRTRGVPPTSPITNEILPNTTLVPNLALRGQIRSME